MIKLIVGPKGAGKTKTMIDMINAAVKTTEGNIVVIEKSMKLTTDINHAARLLDKAGIEYELIPYEVDSMTFSASWNPVFQSQTAKTSWLPLLLSSIGTHY